LFPRAATPLDAAKGAENIGDPWMIIRREASSAVLASQRLRRRGDRDCIERERIRAVLRHG